jgi:hypothetical protein
MQSVMLFLPYFNKSCIYLTNYFKYPVCNFAKIYLGDENSRFSLFLESVEKYIKFIQTVCW